MDLKTHSNYFNLITINNLASLLEFYSNTPYREVEFAIFPSYFKLVSSRFPLTSKIGW